MLRTGVVAISAFTSFAFAFTPCPIQGPDFPAPSSLAKDSIFQDALKNISASLDNVTEASSALLTDLKANETSYSINVFDFESTLLSYHHTADAAALAPESVSNVTDDTVYRVGSISKLLFIYNFLVEVGHDHWHRPITDLVPELEEAAASCSAKSDPWTCPDWDEITLGALASHISGAGRGRPVAPAYTDIEGVPVTDFGLPPQPKIDLEQCKSQPCTRAESIRAFLQEAPVEAAFTAPVYSNGAYQLLTYALEAITNKTMPEMIQDDVFCPLNMDDSSYALENNTRGVIPGSLQKSGWALPLGDAGATGGMYSSPRDLVKLGQAILNNTQLSPASTRRWLKPWSHTAVWQQSMGLAWEIARWPVGDRIVDVYTKQGDFGAYSSRFAIIPDYNIGVTVFTAGTGGPYAQMALFETVLAELLPGIDATARAQAETNFAGTYTSTSSDVNTTISLTTNPTMPGLKVTSFISNSSDVINTLFTAVSGDPTPDLRLYPTDLVGKTGNGTMVRKYNAAVSSPNAEYPNSLIESMNCLTWAMVGNRVYGAIALDEVWIETDESGKAIGVELRAFGAKMERAN
ncbi:hypothetical protein Q7P37_001955 [Cladosporium fusiforme]